MSALEIMTQQYENMGDVHLDDPALEEELFGELTPEIRAELFASADESDTKTSSPESSVDTPATSLSSQTTTTTPELDEETLNAEAARKCFGDGAVTGTTKVGKLVKTSTQLNREAEKRVKLERREAALKTKAKAQQKRKRGDDEDGDERVAKRELSDVAAVEMKKPTPAPVTSGVQKRKRGGDEDEEDRSSKRGLTDAAAAEIAKRDEHTFSDDLEKVKERSDSITNASAEGMSGMGTESTSVDGKAVGKHLAPPVLDHPYTAAANGLTVTDDDDEMTRMLKEELAKPDNVYYEVYTDHGPEPEDPRIEEILRPLTEHEKRTLADLVTKNTSASKGLTNRQLENAVEMALKTRAAGQAKRKGVANVPKKTSPLANDGVAAEEAAEEQEIEGRVKAKPKSRRKVRGPNTTKTNPVAPPTASAPDSTATEDGELMLDPSPRAPAAAPSLSTNNPLPAKANTDYTSLTLPELKKFCKERSLIITGNKTNLVERLVGHDADVAVGRVPKGLKAVGNGKKGKGKGVPLGTS